MLSPNISQEKASALALLQRAAFWSSIALILGVALLLFAKALPTLDKPFPGFKIMADRSVQNLLPVSWTGFHAGLNARDLIKSYDGHPLLSAPDLYAYVQAKPLGTPITYQVARSTLNGHMTLMSKTISTQRFGLQNWISYFLANWLSGVWYLAIGAFVSIRKPKDPVARSHLWFCLSYAIFMVTVFSQDTDYTFGSVGLEAVLLTLFSITSMNLGFQFPRRMGSASVNLGWRLLGAFAGVLTLWASLALNPVERFRYTAHLIVYLFLSLACLVVLANPAWTLMSRSSTLRQRAQSKIIIFGILGCILFGLIPPLLSYYGYSIPLYGLDCLINLTFPATVAYAIVRHQLFDIDVLIKRTLTYALVASALTVLYALITGGSRLALGNHGPLSGIVATALVAIAFVPIRDRVKAWLDATFFRSDYRFETVLADFTRLAQVTPDPELLARAYVAGLESALAPTWLAVHRLKPTGYSLLAEAGASAVVPLTAALPPETIEQPLVVQGEIIGIARMGPKKSELAYSDRDRALFADLTQQLAIWLNLFDRHEQSRAQHAEIEALIQAKELQGQFLNVVSHELKAPLSVTMSSVNLLRFYGEPDAQTLGTHLGRIKRSSAQLMSLVSDLLHAGQLQSGTFHLNLRPCSLATLVMETLAELELLAQQKGHTVTTSLDPATPPFMGDPDRLTQVLRNLLHNAIKYTPDGGVIEVSVRPTGNGVRCDVRDNGPGVAVDDLGRLFQRFSRAATAASAAGGVGLGLFIARELVRAHGGEIGVEPHSDKGCTFWFQIPLEAMLG